MLNKKTISREILGLTGISFVIATFFFMALRVLSNLVVISYCEKMVIELSLARELEIEFMIKSISFIAAAVLFVVLFLFLIGEKIEAAVRSLQEQEVQIIRSISHDIRTPLTSILAYSELMKNKENIEQNDINDYISLIQRKAEQMKHLTDQLLDNRERKLEEIEDGRLLMAQLADEWESALEMKYNCEIDLMNCPQFHGAYDIRELRRVFDNLVSNVEKYADENHPVYLEFSGKDGKVAITQKNRIKTGDLRVESRGIGMESIGRIAEAYGGRMNVSVSEEDYCIEVVL